MIPTVPSCADPPAPGSPDFVAIDAYLAREMRKLRIPGLALGIVRNDGIVHLRGFGVGDASGQVVTPQTPYILASASKSFTAAIMQLAEEGRVNLDTAVVTYLPSFSVGGESASATITVRHLLTTTYQSEGQRWIVVPMVMITLTLAGVWYGWLRLSSGSIWPVCLFHSAFNNVMESLAGVAIVSSAATMAYVTPETGVVTMAIMVLAAAFLLLRKGADFHKARPSAQRPTIEPRVEARPGQ
jgi:hypothetical protein